MSINFRNLTHAILSNVFKFVDDRSLLRMRGVSKSMKQIVEDNIIKQETLIEQFAVARSESDGEIGLCFMLRQAKLLKWKLIMTSVRSKSRFYKSYSFSFSNLLKWADVTVKSVADLREILKSLKPIAKQELDVVFEEVQDEVIQLSLDFLDGTAMRKFFFTPIIPGIIGFSQAMEIVSKWRPKFAQLRRFPYATESYEFLFKIAEVVEEILFSIDTNGVPEAEYKTPLSVIKEILTRKCNNLWLLNYNCFTIADIEKIINFFHHTGKTMFFSTYIHDSIDGAVGIYGVNRITEYPEYGRRMTISNVEFDG